MRHVTQTTCQPPQQTFSALPPSLPTADSPRKPYKDWQESRPILDAPPAPPLFQNEKKKRKKFQNMCASKNSIPYSMRGCAGIATNSCCATSGAFSKKNVEKQK